MGDRRHTWSTTTKNFAKISICRVFSDTVTVGWDIICMHVYVSGCVGGGRERERFGSMFLCTMIACMCDCGLWLHTEVVTTGWLLLLHFVDRTIRPSI